LPIGLAQESMTIWTSYSLGGKNFLTDVILRDGRTQLDGNCVAVRSRKEGKLGEVNVDAVIEKLNEEVRMRAL